MHLSKLDFLQKCISIIFLCSVKYITLKFEIQCHQMNLKEKLQKPTTKNNNNQKKKNQQQKTTTTRKTKKTINNKKQQQQEKQQQQKTNNKKNINNGFQTYLDVPSLYLLDQCE